MTQENSSVYQIKYEYHHPEAPESFLKEVVARATPKAISSAILYRTSLKESLVAGLDGSSASREIDQAEFEFSLNDFADSVLPDASAAVVASSLARSRAAAHRANGLVPIFVGAYRFHVIRDRVWTDLEHYQEKGSADIDWSENHLFEERRAFLASTMLAGRFAGFAALPHVHFGQKLRFVVPSDGFVGNADVADEFQIDFGDGRGFLEVRRDQPVEVNYPSTGAKNLALQAGSSTARFRIVIEEDLLASLEDDSESVIHRVTGPPGVDGSAKVEALLLSRTLPIRKPVLLIEGFPFNYEWTDLLKYADQQRFASRLIQNGYDVFLVRFPTGPMSIQANGLALVELIKTIIAARQGQEPLAIGGFSMGGLVARYALALMEHPESNQPPHQTNKFFTIDTPHEGANVSVAVQAFAQVEDPDGVQATLMRSAAAQQALLHWVPAWRNWRDKLEFGASPLRVRFLADLQRWGFMPKLTDTIAIANGAGNGGVNQDEPGKFAVGYSCERKAWANLLLASRYGLGTALVMRRRNVFDWTVYRVESTVETPGFDSVPGGIWEVPIFRRIYDNIPAIGPRRSLEVENGSFIPTVSALGIKVDNYYRPLTIEDLKSSYFKKVTYHQGQPANEVHVRLTPQLAGFLLTQVFGIT